MKKFTFRTEFACGSRDKDTRAGITYFPHSLRNVLLRNFKVTLLRQLNAPWGVTSNTFGASLRKLETTLIAFRLPCGLEMRRHPMVVVLPDSFQLTSSQFTSHQSVPPLSVMTLLLSLITFKSLLPSSSPPSLTLRRTIMPVLMESLPFLSRNVQPPFLNLCCSFLTKVHLQAFFRLSGKTLLFFRYTNLVTNTKSTITVLLSFWV